MDSPLILPGDPEFDFALGSTPPPAQQGQAFVVRPGSLIMEPVTDQEFDEYVQSGEYDDRLAEIEDDDDDANWWDED